MSETENTAMCTVMGPQWVKEQQARQLRMDRLYVLDGRHRKDHEMHGLYTGLAEKAEELEKELDG
tara:strand:- start:367 stop:561 length:195 start_codon:yes stop_codon:yes gene_type:complete